MLFNERSWKKKQIGDLIDSWLIDMVENYTTTLHGVTWGWTQRQRTHSFFAFFGFLPESFQDLSKWTNSVLIARIS